MNNIGKKYSISKENELKYLNKINNLVWFYFLKISKIELTEPTIKIEKLNIFNTRVIRPAASILCTVYGYSWSKIGLAIWVF
jgi:hypothetical protein